MNDLINKIRNNNAASWGLALFMGLIFRYVDGIARHQIFTWCRNFDFGTSTHPTPETQFFTLTVVTNLALNLGSSLIASTLCGSVLVCIFQEKASRLSLAGVVVFWALSSRLWRFWRFPELGMQISSFMGPILAGIVFLSTVYLIQKVKDRITLGLTSRR